MQTNDTHFGDYQTVEYDPKYDEQIIMLQKHLWGQDTTTSTAYLDWKYKRNPYTPPLIILTLYKDKVVGMLGFMGSQWEIGSPKTRFLVPCGSDLVIDPAHRGRGLFQFMWKNALATFQSSEYPYIFILSGHEHSIRITMKLGWKSIGSLQRQQFSSHPPRYIRIGRKISRKILASGESSRAVFHQLDRWNNKNKKQYPITVWKSPPVTEMAALITSRKDSGRCRHIRDEKFLTWRYENPFSEYRFLLWEGTPPKGYLVLQTRAALQTEAPWANIVDWEAASPDIQAALLHTVVREGGFNKVTIWSATLSNQAKSILSSSGFVPLPDTVGDVPYPTVLVKATRTDTPETDWKIADKHLLDLNNWDIRGIYSDGF